jgi:hypothetical protein
MVEEEEAGIMLSVSGSGVESSVMVLWLLRFGH